MSADRALRAFYEKVTAESLPKTPLFGTPLDKYMDLQKKGIPFLNEPWIVRKCCDYLRDNGLKIEGVFRVPGSATTVKKISDQFDAGLNPDFTSLGAFVEDVAGVLKKYLRDQPDPLISDGTADDPLQKAFLEALEMEEDSPEQLSTFNTLMKQLPNYRKALLADLFHLFSCIVAHSQWNLMTPDNVATIFGGMTDIMTSIFNPTQRSHLVRLLIEHHSVIFEGLFELTPKPNDPQTDGLKEAIRVYLHDGTFKSLYCIGNEVAKDIQKKTISKIQQTTDIDPAKYKLYEIRDAEWRKIGSDEKILPIIKSGSAVLITDRLKGDRNQIPTSPSPTPAADHTKLAVSKVPKLKKSEKSPRGERESKSEKHAQTDISPAGTLQKATSLSLSKLAGQTSLSRPSPRPETLAPLNQPVQLLLWVFRSIPSHSVRATEWDPDSTVEGSVELKCTPQGSVITIITAEQNWIFTPTQASSVEDSTRYFVMSSDEHRIGLGFETREEASKYKSVVAQMIQYDQVHAIRPDISERNSSVKFASGPLSTTDMIEEGFYDTGIIAPTLPALKDVTALDLSSPEVILVDQSQDLRLARLLEIARSLVSTSQSRQEKLKTLALFVSNVFGGIDISEGTGNLDEVSEHDSLASLSVSSLISLRTKINSNIVKLGNVIYGLDRHRAILFKYLADRMEPKIPVAIGRTIPTSSKSSVYAICVPTAIAGQFVFVDLVNDPGLLYPSTSTYSKSIVSHMHGKLTDLDSSLEPKAASDSASNLPEHKLSPPVVDEKSVLRMFTQIACSAKSSVFRGVLGTVHVAIKEVPCAEDANLKAELLELAKLRVKLSHPNIALTYGYESGATSFRFVGEYFGLGSLKDHNQTRKLFNQHWEETTIWHIIHEVAKGLSHLHSNEQCHGNLTSSNVLVDGDGISPTFALVKLSDPLLSKSSSSWTASADSWRAPEVLSEGDSANNYAADVWSLGMLIFELTTLTKPFSDLHSHDEIVAAITGGKLPSALPQSSPFYVIINECCSLDPSTRPSIDKLVEKSQSHLNL